jgi:hypothetical protein
MAIRSASATASESSLRAASRHMVNAKHKTASQALGMRISRTVT